MDFPYGSVIKNPAIHAGDMGSIPGLGRYPGDEHGNIFLPGKSHWQMRLVGCTPWGSNRVRHYLATKNNKNNKPTLRLWDESNWTIYTISFVYVTKFSFLGFFFFLPFLICLFYFKRGSVHERWWAGILFSHVIDVEIKDSARPHGMIEWCSCFHFRKSLWKLCFNSLWNVCWSLPTFKEKKQNKTY